MEIDAGGGGTQAESEVQAAAAAHRLNKTVK
jgi:hypothetical protein